MARDEEALREMMTKIKINIPKPEGPLTPGLVVVASSAELAVVATAPRAGDPRGPTSGQPLVAVRAQAEFVHDAKLHDHEGYFGWAIRGWTNYPA